MLRRRQRTETAPPPQWQSRFDDAVELIRSQPQPPWLDDRLRDLERSLAETHSAQKRLDASMAQLGVEQTAAQLKTALRDRQGVGPGVDRAVLDRRIETLRHRYEAVNDMANRRDRISEHLLTTVADVELLAVRAVHSGSLDTQPADDLSEHLERLDIDLRSLELARREINEL